MIKVNIDVEDRYPIYTVNNECGEGIELSEDLYNKAIRIQKEYNELQDQLEEIYESKEKENEKKRNTIKLTVNTIQADVPTLNDRIYTKECMDKMMEQINAKIISNTMFVTIENDNTPDGHGINLNTIAATINSCSCEDGKLNVECQIVDNSTSGRILKDILNDDNMNKFNVTPRIIGDVNEDKTVRVDDVISFGIQPK